MKVSRLIFGHDIITGIAHSGELIYVSGLIRTWFTDEKILQTFQKAEEMGINTQFLRIDERNVRLAKQYRKERGGKLQYIAQCSLNQGDVKRDADFALEAGATHIYIIGTQTDSMISNGTFKDVVPKALEYFKQNKVYCGLAGHSIEVAMTAEKMKLPTDFYVKTFHSTGYWSAGLQKVPRDPNFTPTDKQMVQPEYGVAAFRHDNLWDIDSGADSGLFRESEQALDRLQGTGRRQDPPPRWIRVRPVQRSGLHGRRNVRIPDRRGRQVSQRHHGQRAGSEADAALDLDIQRTWRQPPLFASRNRGLTSVFLISEMMVTVPRFRRTFFNMSELVILSTAETIAIAHNIARTLVESGEAACVNIVPGIQSIYSWQGTVFEEGELMLLIQATSDKFESIRSTIRRLSTCNLPQIIALPITVGDMDYLRWLGGIPIFP